MSRLGDELLAADAPLDVVKAARDVFGDHHSHNKDVLLSLQTHPLLLNKIITALTDDTSPLRVLLKLQTLYLALCGHIPISSAIVLDWFALMASTMFLSDRLQASTDPDLESRIVAMAQVVSLEIVMSGTNVELG